MKSAPVKINRYVQVSTAKPCCRSAVRQGYTPNQKTQQGDLFGKCTCEYHSPKVKRRKFHHKITLIKRG